ncbi:hypothetical protein [Azospirillum brasilense]|nr:hypothetical protein [Azospirillum brasilense]
MTELETTELVRSRPAEIAWTLMGNAPDVSVPEDVTSKVSVKTSP